jgi:endonuclease YncB( thermonuclease family)
VTDADMNPLKRTGTGRVERVLDGQTILMADGKIIRLLGVFYPWRAEQQTPPEERETMIAGKEMLETLLPKGVEVLIYQTRQANKGRVNRMGQTLAHLLIKSDMVWVNGTLIARGLAYTYLDDGVAAMAAPLITLERRAQGDGRGLWAAGSPYGVLSPDTAGGMTGFFIVEGKITTAASKNNNLYLNFGADWKKDFTVQIAPPVRKALLRAGIDPLSLSGKIVRVRGWIRDWNGPFVELTTAHNLEVVEK